jgi:4a-hydroxytetrahydrobiopterin dehydratase
MKKDTIEISSDMELSSRECGPCEGSEGRLKPAAIKQLLKQLSRKWKLQGGKQLERTFKFPDFQQALDFTNHVGEIAESQGHHPDIYLTYGEVRLQLSSHQAKGLTENDFILAAKIDELVERIL